jgi:hypothetical protein
VITTISHYIKETIRWPVESQELETIV